MPPKDEDLIHQQFCNQWLVGQVGHCHVMIVCSESCGLDPAVHGWGPDLAQLSMTNTSELACRFVLQFEDEVVSAQLLTRMMHLQ